MDEGVRWLIAAMPETVGRFEGTEWPLPVAWAFHAGPPEIERLRETLVKHADDDIKKSIEAALCVAELIEAAQPDRQTHFITDNQARTYAFRGAKWRAGWVCLVGSDQHAELARRFKQDRWLVFAAGATLSLSGRGEGEGAASGGSASRAPQPHPSPVGLPGGEREAMPDVDVHLGDRPTALVYFLQLMVRYGFIYGLIPPGEDHELGHFLERDMPGVVVATGPLSPVEALLVLGLMYLGAPAVVRPSFPYDYGRRAFAASVDEIVAAAGRFPNLRVRKTVAGQVALPDFCDPAHRSEKWEASRTWGGSAASWFCVRPASVREGVTVHGSPGPDMGLLIEIGDPRCNNLVTDWFEGVAGAAPSYIHGVRADLKAAPRIDLAADATATPEQVAEAIRAVLRHQYPLLQDVRVTLTFDRATVERLRPEVLAFQTRRREAVDGLRDRTVQEVYSCIDCQTFAHGHVCFLTPGRPSMVSSALSVCSMLASTSQPITDDA